MGKTLFTIVLLAWLLIPAVVLAAFNHSTFRANLPSDKDFMKYFMRFVAVLMLLIGVLFISCLLNYPIIDKLFNSQKEVNKMEKTLVAVLVLWVLFALIISMIAFNYITLRYIPLDDPKFIKTFIEYVFLTMLCTGILLLSVLLNFPIIDKAWLLLQ